MQSGVKLNHKLNFMAKIMLIFNTYKNLNLNEKINSINKAYVWITIILPIITNVQKTLLHTGGACLATGQKWPNLP